MENIELYAKNAKEFYEFALNNTDPRLIDYPLVWKDPRPIMGLILVYLIFVIYGQKIMQNRAPVKVPPWILFTYNFGLVLLSVYMLEEIIVGAIQSNYDFTCAKLNVSTSKEEMRVSNALWLYFFSKAIELLDTFWMVIRKRFNQITFLHVFHHSTMLVIWWIVCNWIPGGQSYFGAALNCLVHVFMYTYYAFSVIPSFKDKLWWKKYITSIQLVQFFITFSHTIQGIVRNCEFPMWGQYLLAFYMIFMIILFTNFYVHEYIKKSNAMKKKKLDQNNNELNKNGHIKNHHSNNLNNHHNNKKD